MDRKKGYAIAWLIFISIFLFQCNPEKKKLRKEWERLRARCVELLPVEKHLNKLEQVKNKIDSRIRIITELKSQYNPKPIGLLKVFLKDFRPLLSRSDTIESIYIGSASIQIRFRSVLRGVEESWLKRIEKGGLFSMRNARKASEGRFTKRPLYMVFMSLRDEMIMNMDARDPQLQSLQSLDLMNNAYNYSPKNSSSRLIADSVNLDIAMKRIKKEREEMILSITKGKPPSGKDELKSGIDELIMLSRRLEKGLDRLDSILEETRYKESQLRELDKIFTLSPIDKKYTETEFRKYAEGNGVNIHSFKFLNPVDHEAYEESPFEVECEAPLAWMPDFLLYLVRMTRIYSITDFRAVPVEDSGDRFHITLCVSHFLRKGE